MSPNNSPARGLTIGVAGHFRHGKTSLVGALTGVDTGESVDEKRGYSTDVGVAPLFLPSGTQATILDFPGHRRYVNRLIAGLSGIDILLWVIAADAGVTPPALDHLELAGLLGVKGVVAVVTKTDLAASSRLADVQEQIREILSARPHLRASFAGVSAVGKTGLGELLSAIEGTMALVPRRPLDFPVRLPLLTARPRSVSAFTVSGTVWSGVLSAGGDFDLQPSGEPCRLLELEIDDRPVSKALPGQYVSLAIEAAGRKPVAGDFLFQQAIFTSAAEIIARIQVLPGSPTGVSKTETFRLHHGTGSTLARIEPLSAKVAAPGYEGFARVVPSHKIAAVFRDAFVIRTVAESVTVGGGVVLDTQMRPGRLPANLDRLCALAGTDTEVVAELLRGKLFPLTVEDIAFTARLPESAANRGVEHLASANRLTRIDAWRTSYYVDTESLDESAEALRGALRVTAGSAAPRKSIVRSELWPELSSSQADILFNHFQYLGIIELKGDALCLSESENASPHKIGQIELRRLLRGFSPPEAAEIPEAMGITRSDATRLLESMLEEGEIAAVGSDYYYMTESLEQIREILTEYVLEAGEITVSKLGEILEVTDERARVLLSFFEDSR